MYRRSCVGFANNQDVQAGHLDLQAAALVNACDNALCEVVRLQQDHEFAGR